jgi:hypothetical protein
MSDRVNPFELLEDVSPNLEKVLEDPFSVNFRGKEEDLIELYPEHLSFRQATVDIANQNVELKTNKQRETEGYNTLIYGEGIALVESKAEIRIDDRAAISTTYYLVTDDKTLMYNGENWEDIYNPTPRDAASLAPKLYQKALEYTPNSEETERKQNTTVPPPEQGDFTEKTPK